MVMGAREAQPFCDGFGSGVLKGPGKRRQQPRPAAGGTGPSGERDEWACKPNSVPRRGEVVAIYLGHRLLGVSGDLPEETGEQPARTWVEAARHLPLAWSCSRWGLPGRPSHLDRRWSLTPPFHSYRAAQVPRVGHRTVAATCFLLHLPSSRLAWVLPSIVLCGVRTFLMANTSVRHATTRPTRPNDSMRQGSCQRRPALPVQPLSVVRGLSIMSVYGWPMCAIMG